MPQNILTKRCYKCNTTKPLSEFHKDCTKKNGYHCTCIQCVKSYKKIHEHTPQAKESRKKRDERKRRKYPDKIKARALLNYAVDSGKIPKPIKLICACGQPAKEYHHLDYHSKRGLNIIPVCISCHKKLHMW